MEITLKHICREFDLDPYPLRQYLRKHTKKQKHQRWKWSSDDPALSNIRKLAKELKDAQASRAKLPVS